MITRRSALAGLGAGLAAAVAQSAVAADIGAQIDAILQAKLSSEHVPGAAFLAVREGKIVHAAAYGLRDREHNLPVTLDTLFPIGSATKSFTSMTVGRLQDKGLLHLDDRPHAYLPYFHMYDPEANAKVALRDMLSHQTGLRTKADLAAIPAVLTREELVRATTSARPAYPFRRKFQYSNTMITAAGEVIAHVAGAPWEDVVTREVLRPLGMKTALPTIDGVAATPDHVTGYVYDSAKADWVITPPSKSLIAMAPAGAIVASANEMAHWLNLLTAGGMWNGKRFVSEETFRQIIAPQISISPDQSYALCWVNYEWNGERVVEHNGGGEGICALVSFLPDQRAGFVFLGNTSPNFLTKIGNLGPLIYPLLLGATEVKSVRVPSAHPAVEPAPLPSPPVRPAPALPDIDLETLLARMIAAAGGEALMRHKSLTAVGEKSYENQGIQGLFTLRASVGSAHEETETWTAAGREIGRLRIYFDGQTGGQETTFGQDALNDEATDAAFRRDYDFQPLLRLRDLYKTVAISGTGWVGDKSVITLSLTDDSGTIAELSVGSDDFLIARRFAGGEEMLYSDYRKVDGEQVAFAQDTNGALGLISVRWHEVAFDKDIAKTAFQAAPR